MYIYLAGYGVNERDKDMIRQHGTRHRLYSFFYDVKYVGQEPWAWDRCLWDSGGFTARKTGQPISIDSYIQFINEKKIRFAFNLDTNDLEETWQNQKTLEEKTQAYIIPIYHYQSWLGEDHRWLEDLKRYPFVSLGGMVGQKKRKSVEAFIQFVYGVIGMKRVHLLGKTSEPLLRKFPAYSGDSTNWVMPSKFNNIVTDRHLKNLTRFRSETMKYHERIMTDIHIYRTLEEKMTSLWCHRGIHFGCPHDELDFIGRKDGHELARTLIGSTQKSALEL